jgi:serine/threonine-protein kinase
MPRSHPWPRIRAWFDEALERDGPAREAFLAQLAAAAPEAAATVRRLLAAHERDPAFLDGTAADLLGDLRALLDAPGEPTRLGRYRVEGRIGEGGMATVYRAVPDDGTLDRPVAIKVARAAADARLAAAIGAERDILARLSHPHIAHLYDAGLTADGRPYLVMEYVEGVAITTHCTERRLALAARIALLRDVCAAVDYAHRHLVVHRDIKPSNVLVTADGTVKLLDFGVAKVLGPDTATGDASARTNPALTPAYAAPEQLRRERVTTAADVWGLGVLAYELVTGVRPHDVDGLSAAAAERAICTGTPLAPSLAARRAGLGLGLPASGDLDAVILKALRAEPGARYATAVAFAEDLAAALDGRPVRARAPTAGYRAVRFARRNRTAVAAATVAVVALLVTTAVAVRQARAARALAARVEGERARAARINRFLQGVLATANPSWYVNSAEKGPDVTVLRALELAASRMERELADDPETRADIHHTLGDTYRAIGRYEAMGRHLDSALAIRERVFRPPHPKIADALYYAMIPAWQRGQWDRSDSLLRAAIAMQRARDEGNNLPYMLESAASGAIRRGEYRRAAALAQESVALFAARHDPTHIGHVVSEDVLAHALLQQGLRDSAGAVAARLTAHSRRSGRRDAAPLHIAASLAAHDGRFAEADTLFGAYLASLTGTGRVEHRLLRVRAVLLPAGRTRDAARELAVARAELDALPPPVAGWPVPEVEWRALQAQLALAEGDAPRAVALAREALDRARRALGGARHDAFWRSRVTANDVLARVHDACGDARTAAAVRRATLRELATRDVPAIQRDTVAARIARAPAPRGDAARADAGGADARRAGCAYEVARS